MGTIRLLTAPMRGIVRFPLFQLFAVAAAIAGLLAAADAEPASATVDYRSNAGAAALVWASAIIAVAIMMC